jgi:hypothetical protein
MTKMIYAEIDCHGDLTGCLTTESNWKEREMPCVTVEWLEKWIEELEENIDDPHDLQRTAYQEGGNNKLKELLKTIKEEQQYDR